MKLFIILFIFHLFSFTPSMARDKGRDYEVFQIETQSDSVKYKADVYRPLSRRIKYMLIISPTIDGITSLEVSNAQYFSKRGYVVIIPHPYQTQLSRPRPDVEKLNSDFYSPAISAIALINAVDHKLNLPQTTPIFTLGASQGGISSLIITATVPRVKALWFAVGGANLPYIFAHSEVEQLVKFRNNHMRILGMSNPKKYEEYLRIYLLNDPAIICKDITVPFHQTIATRDLSVPTITQELLVKECPQHSVSRKNVNHVSGSLSTVLDRQEIMEFFENSI